MPALKTCRECGRFFGAKGDEALCSSCNQAQTTKLAHISDPEEQKFVYARNTVYDFPDISPMDLVRKMTDEGIDITIVEVMSYVKAGRLILKGVGNGEFCEECGIKILSGRRCPVCTSKLEQAIAHNSLGFADTSNAGMSDKKQGVEDKSKSSGSRMYSQN